MRRWVVLLVGLLPLLAACAGREAAEEAAQIVGTPPASEAVQAPVNTPTPLLTEADIVAPTPSGLSLQPKLAEADIDLDEVVALLPPDAIPAVMPEREAGLMVSAAEAEAGGIDPNVRLIGVSLNGESRAYPIPFLSRHEIVNTTIGGRPLAVTW